MTKFVISSTLRLVALTRLLRFNADVTAAFAHLQFILMGAQKIVKSAQLFLDLVILMLILNYVTKNNTRVEVLKPKDLLITLVNDKMRVSGEGRTSDNI